MAKSIIMMPFFLTRPISMMIPTNAYSDSSASKTQSVSTAPKPANGSADRIVIGCRKFS